MNDGNPIADDNPDHWRVLGARTVFQAAPFVHVEQQTVLLPDGRVIDDYFRLDLGDYACVYPVAADGRAILLRQYSHGLGRVALGFPGGHCKPGEDPADAVRRELMEETGHAAGTLVPLASAVVDGNKRCALAHLFLALDCRPVAAPDSGDLEAARIVMMGPGELVDAVASGEIAVLAHLALVGLSARARPRG